MLTPVFKAPDVRRFGRLVGRGCCGAAIDARVTSYKFVTLTTPESGIIRVTRNRVSFLETDLNHIFRLWRLRLKRLGISFPYICVTEWNKKQTCEHIHLIARTEFVSYETLRDTWCALTGAKWIKVVDCYGEFKFAMYYLAKYMGKAPSGARSFWYSRDWVYTGFANVARDYFILMGENIPADVLAGCLEYDFRERLLIQLAGKLDGAKGISESIRLKSLAGRPKFHYGEYGEFLDWYIRKQNRKSETARLIELAHKGNDLFVERQYEAILDKLYMSWLDSGV